MLNSFLIREKYYKYNYNNITNKILETRLS